MLSGRLCTRPETAYLYRNTNPTTDGEYWSPLWSLDATIDSDPELVEVALSALGVQRFRQAWTVGGVTLALVHQAVNNPRSPKMPGFGSDKLLLGYLTSMTDPS